MLDSPRIKTEIPGPKSRALMERKRRAISRGWANAIPVFVKEARGALVTDVDGNTFIDFAGGIGATNVGHLDPRVVGAIKEQAETLVHTAFQAAPYEPFVELAEKLNALVPGRFEKKTIFANSGSEAVENAVKISRAHTGRGALLAFGNGLHGRTLLGMTLTSKIGPFKEGFGPFAPEVYRVPAPYPYRCPAGKDCSGGCRGDCFGFVEETLEGEVGAEALAAVILEPVSGEGGFIPFPDFYLRRLRELCDEHGILLIADEIQTGFGRTGKMFAIEHSGVAPDLLTASKSLAGGMPLSAVIGRAEVMDSVEPGGLGGTFSGNPVACAAALAVLKVFEEDDLLSRAGMIGERVMGAIREMQEKYPYFIGDVRGRGPMAAMELVKDPKSRAPDKERAALVAENALQKGLMLLMAGQHANVIRTLMPLSITDDELDEGLCILDRAVGETT
ncbi:MAG TPA: 4-aminobutyrate--2-oxoglutarate transaminase [Rubrobacteraceae bacterium]|nr:4-aminobutyrate--2-oxoglutarate transaminase [Rubrobacteraceae bacterium]